MRGDCTFEGLPEVESCMAARVVSAGEMVLAAEGIGNRLAGEFDEMRVVGEEENLGPGAKFGEDRQGGPGAGVVEADENVVQYEGQRIAQLHLAFQGGDPERQIKLVACALAHAADFHLLP